MKYLAILLVALLLVAHQDYWQWGRDDLVLGFLPYTMAWHMGLCLVSAVVWVWITLICWPKHLDSTTPDGPSRERAP